MYTPIFSLKASYNQDESRESNSPLAKHDYREILSKT